jgi:hypothetical protein
VECEVTPAGEIFSLAGSFRLFRLQWDGSVELSGSVLATSLIVEHRNVRFNRNQSLTASALAQLAEVVSGVVRGACQRRG